jgi:nucleoside-diphosphate-sugar epimerase
VRALIFGCGYLGRRVADAWVHAGHEVFGVTRSGQNAERFRQAKILPFIADICDKQSLDHLPAADLVLHSVGFDRSAENSHAEVTYGGMTNILAALSDRCSRFVFTSSTSVYGQSGGEWVHEGSRCEPTQPGGQLCLSAENLVRERFPDSGPTAVNILRLAGIYGPDRLLSRVESLQARVALAGRSDSWLNLIHVDDAAGAVLACAQPSAPRGTYNVVDDRPIERGEYFRCLAELVGAPTPVFDATQPSARGSGGLNKRCSNGKLREDLVWTPAYPSIDTGLPAAIRSSAK